MKKIAVLTRRYGYNFGSSLQAFAMRVLLEELGHSITILNYDEFSQHPIWYIKPLLNKLTGELCRIFFQKSNKSKKYKTTTKQIKGFDLFDQDFIKPSRHLLRSSRALYNATKEMDCVICGSDQIWSPKIFDKNYFLPFCTKNNILKISYAPSFGVKNLSQYRDEIKKYLLDFNYISVREEEGFNITKELLNRDDISIVLDPTMMIETRKWIEIERQICLPHNYIICYFLGNNIPFDFINSFQKRNNIPIYNITTFRTRNRISGYQLDSLSPLEFIYAIRHADYVITDSFHACVFSLLFEVNFFATCKHSDSENGGENSRIYTLLKKFNVEDRLIPNNNFTEMFDKKINFDQIKESLYHHKNKSISFLIKAIE